MDYRKLEGRSQEDMQAWFDGICKGESRLLRQGVIPRMAPKFIGCNFLDGTLEVAYEALDWELNPQNIIHGGIISTAFDTTMGMLSHYYVKPHVVTTVSLNTTFHKPIMMGDTFHVKAKIEFLGRSLSSTTGEIFTKEYDVLAATATATFKILHELQHDPLT